MGGACSAPGQLGAPDGRAHHGVARRKREPRESAQSMTLHWNGTAWSAMPGPTGSDPNTEVTGLSALPSGEAWAVGATFSSTAAAAFIAHHTP